MATAVTPDLIAEAATAPASASVDGQSATAVPVDQQIAADVYAKSATTASGANANGGARTGWGALRPARAILPGQT